MKYSQCTTEKERVNYLKGKLNTSPKWALRGLVRLYERQTNDERRSWVTTHKNYVGFDAADAKVLSSFAEQHLAGRSLSKNQMTILLSSMPKYARQLNRIARSKKGTGSLYI